MKKVIVVFCAFLLSMNAVISQENSTINTDKKLALDLLNRSWEELETVVNGLTDGELNYIPKDGGWSVKNCLEHLALVEPVLSMKINKMISANKLDLSKELSSEDGLIVAYITDRTRKVMTPKPFRPLPENKNKSKEDFLAEIGKVRQALITLLKTTDADLRHLVAPYPYGEADAYQQFIIVGAHTYRHTMQIREVLGELETEKAK